MLLLLLLCAVAPSTVWKFHDFSITHILREIKFEVSRSAKSAILTLLEALNFYFYERLHIKKTEICQFYLFRGSEF